MTQYRVIGVRPFSGGRGVAWRGLPGEDLDWHVQAAEEARKRGNILVVVQEREDGGPWKDLADDPRDDEAEGRDTAEDWQS